MPINHYLLGSAIKITVLISIATASAALITIENPSGTDKVTNGAMTKEADFVYSYTWQSATTDTDGKYKITVSVTSAGYTSVKQAFFDIIDPEDT